MKELKKIGLRMLLLLATVWIAGCGGSDSSSDEPRPAEGLVLKADKDKVSNSGKDTVWFTVLQDGREVTARSSITDEVTHKELGKPYFVPTPGTAAGVYTFKATFQAKSSEAVKVTVTAVGFVKNVLLLQFTSTSCVFCPGLTSMLEKDILPKAPGRFCLLAFHGRSNPGLPDPMERLDYVTSLQRHFGMPNSFPKLIVEHDFLWDRLSGDIDPIMKYTGESAPVGMALQTSLSGRQLTVVVKAKAMAEYPSPCSIAVVLLENGISEMQDNETGGSQQDKHNHVVREYLTDLFGDKESSGQGKVSVDDEWQRTFTYALPEKWNTAEMTVVGYILGTDGKALNCRMVKVGENADYQK